MSPTLTNGYLLTVDGSRASFDLAWKRDQTVELEVFETADKELAHLGNDGVTGGTFWIYSAPGASAALLEGSVVVESYTGGLVSFSVEDTDLASLVWDEGEAVKTLLLCFELTDGTNKFAVLDDAGQRLFPCRVHWGVSS